MAFPFGQDRMPNLIGCVDSRDGNMYVCESNPENLEIRTLFLSQNTGEITYERIHEFESEEFFSSKADRLGYSISKGVFKF